jgi:hypothetical protein
MITKTKLVLAAALVAALASPALANDEWIVNSGRYVNGAVPSYETHGAFYMSAHTPRLIERRNAGYYGAVANSGTGYAGMVQTLGN